MSAEDNYNRLRDELDRQIRNDKRLRAITDKVKAGKATFQDTNRYSDIVSRMLGDILSKNVGEIKVPLGKEYACRELLRDQYERINEVLGDVQVSVDQKLGIHLNPIKAPFPEERVNAVAHSLEDPTVPEETIERRARSATENVSKSFHDDYTKANAEYRSKAGLKCYLVRDAGGGCCKWCAALEGRYDYASAPQDVFRKHDNCTCSVTYECGRMRQDVWSKRKWEATDEELAARKEASEAAKPIKRTREQAEELNRKLTEQSKPVVYTPAEAKELEQKVLAENPIMKNTPEQAKALKAKALGKEDSVNNKSVDNGVKGGIIESGARYGAYNDKNDPNYKKREASAERYYEEIRNRDRNAEIEAISKNTGFSKDDVDAIFSHVFEQEHPFEDGTTHRFVPDYYMQQSFMRIREGKNIQKHDITLLNHELAEYKLMSANPNMVYEEAHAKVEKQYNYAKELLEYLKEKSKKGG